MSPAARRPAAGFTLLEMLIVLALLGLLAAALAGAISLGIAARARGTAVAADAQDFSSLRRILNNQLAEAYPEWLGGQAAHIDFAGTPSRLEFLAPALQTQGPGLSDYQFQIGQANGQPAILLRTVFSVDNPPPALSAYFARGLASAKFTYFGLARDGSGTSWQNDWQMRTIPPELVALTVTFPKGDRRAWPVLVIRLNIDADVTCEIDPQTHSCAGR